MMKKTQTVVLILTIMALIPTISSVRSMEPIFQLCITKYSGSIRVIGCDQFSPDQNFPVTVAGKKLILVERCCLVCTKGDIQRRICLTTTLYRDRLSPNILIFPENMYTQHTLSE